MIDLLVDDSLKSRLVLLCLSYLFQDHEKCFCVILKNEQESHEDLPRIVSTRSEDALQVSELGTTIVCLKWIASQATKEKKFEFYNTHDIQEKANIDRWLIFASKLHFECTQQNDLENLNSYLSCRTFFGSFSKFCLADMVVFASVYTFMNSSSVHQKRRYIHLCRWFNHVQHLPGIYQARYNSLGILFPFCCMDDLKSDITLAVPLCGTKTSLPGSCPCDSVSLEGSNNSFNKMKEPEKARAVNNKPPKEKKKTDVNSSANESVRPVDDPCRLDIRIGKILKAWNHPEATKLFCFDVDIGEDNPRKIVSGIREYYTLDQLEGLVVLVLCNLKPKKLLGFESHGMLLCGKGLDSKNETRIQLVCPPLESKVGERISFETLQGDPDAVLSCKKGKDTFSLVQPHFSVGPEGVAYYKTLRFMTLHGACFCPSLTNGSIS